MMKMKALCFAVTASFSCVYASTACTAINQNQAPGKEEDSALTFQDANAACTYHCHPYQVHPHDMCPLLCKCDSTTRKLMAQSVHVFELLSCEGDSTITASLEKNVELFFSNFTDVYKKIVDSILLDDPNKVEMGCILTLPGVEEHTFTLADIPDAAEVPALVSMKNNEPRCMEQLMVAVDDGQKGVAIVEHDHVENKMIVIIHATQSQAHAVEALSCVTKVVLLPPIMKLAPLARSNFQASNQSIPDLVIKLDDGASEDDVLVSLNDDIAKMTGVTNAISLMVTTEHGEQMTVLHFLVMTEVTNMGTWTTALSAILNHYAVEWVEQNAPLQSFFLDSSSLQAMDQLDTPLSHNSTTRRLDAFIGDVLETSSAWDMGITGNGIIVAVTDTGLFSQHDQFDQPQGAFYDRVDTNARKVVLYNTFGDNEDQSENVVCGHGTHVSGIVLGSSLSGDSRDVGIAPRAKLAFMDIGTQNRGCAGSAGCPVDLLTPQSANDLFSSQVNAGAKIFSFSWGTLISDYNGQTADIDAYLNDNKDIIVVAAAGNSGQEGTSTISSPAGAKNVITVGASLNSGNSFNTCSRFNNPDSVAVFSSRGPTSDGRLKPDIVAPGQIISSAQSSIPPGTNNQRTAMCDLQGTSQSAPAVAGIVALISQWLAGGYWKNGIQDSEFGLQRIPSALVKGLLIHSSSSLLRRLTRSGGSCDGLGSSSTSLQYPDMNQGYGRPRLSNLMEPGAVWFLPDNEESAPVLDQSGRHLYDFTVKTGDIFRVTLVWTDRAGSVNNGGTLQHDLDLSIVVKDSDGTVFFPLSGNGGLDRRNNVEMVQETYASLAASKGGTNGTDIVVTVTVNGFSISGGAQEYAIVASSGSIGSLVVAGEGFNNGFWKPIYTYVLIAVAVAVVLYLVYGCINKRRRGPRNNSYGRHQPQYPRSSAHVPAPGLYGNQQYPAANGQPPSGPMQRNSILHNQNLIKCPHCMYESAVPTVMIQHVEALHSAALNNEQPINPPGAVSNIARPESPAQKCPFCPYLTSSAPGMVDHVEALHADTSNTAPPAYSAMMTHGMPAGMPRPMPSQGPPSGGPQEGMPRPMPMLPPKHFQVPGGPRPMMSPSVPRPMMNQNGPRPMQPGQQVQGVPRPMMPQSGPRPMMNQNGPRPLYAMSAQATGVSRPMQFEQQVQGVPRPMMPQGGPRPMQPGQQVQGVPRPMMPQSGPIPLINQSGPRPMYSMSAQAAGVPRPMQPGQQVQGVPRPMMPQSGPRPMQPGQQAQGGPRPMISQSGPRPLMNQSGPRPMQPGQQFQGVPRPMVMPPNGPMPMQEGTQGYAPVVPTPQEPQKAQGPPRPMQAATQYAPQGSLGYTSIIQTSPQGPPAGSRSPPPPPPGASAAANIPVATLATEIAPPLPTGPPPGPPPPVYSLVLPGSPSSASPPSVLSPRRVYSTEQDNNEE